MTESFYYSRFIKELEDRFDVNYNNPAYDIINSLLSKACYSVLALGDSRCLKTITKGKTPKGLHYIDDGVPFIGSTQIVAGSVTIDDAPKIPMKIHRTRLAGSQIEKGNVLITMAGTIGRSAAYNYDDECNANQAIAILDINQEEVEPEFLARYLNSQLGQLFFCKLQTLSSQPNINFEEIKRIKLILPHTTEEQKNIVIQIQAIETEAKKLENEAETIAEEAASTLLNELGVNMPRREMSSYFFKSGEEKTISFSVMPSEISDRMQYLFFHPKYALLESMQERYSTVRFENICAEPIHRGEQPEYEEIGVVTVVKTVNLKNSYIDYENCLKVSQDFFEKYPSAQIKKNDILVASTGLTSMGKAVVHIKDEPTIVDGHISIVRLKEGYDPYFVTYFLRSHLGQIQFEKWFSGSSGQIEIQPEDLNQFVLPDNSEQGVSSEEQIRIASEITKRLDNSRLLRAKSRKKWAEAKDVFEQSLYVSGYP